MKPDLQDTLIGVGLLCFFAGFAALGRWPWGLLLIGLFLVYLGLFHPLVYERSTRPPGGKR